MARADEQKVGKTWSDEELDAIVADYFQMLEAEIAGHPYVKSEHSRALMGQIRRTHRSVEFKHQNISAVLEMLGLPWIPGYKPKANYQKAIAPAIERYLSRNPEALEARPKTTESPERASDVFVEPPDVLHDHGRSPSPESLRRLARKYDPVERDRRNQILGKAGEDFVVDLERRRLTQSGCPDLARRIRWVAAEDGDGAGYDVLSFDASGSERLLEVKTTNGSARTPFFLTRNELEIAEQRPEQWRLYRVHLFAIHPRVFVMEPPLDGQINLRAETWRASF